MAEKIVILEDNDDRQQAMLRFLEDRFRQYESAFFAVAQNMIDYLQTHLHETIVVSLDHDLEMLPDSSGKLRDPGTGREVADFLADHKPAFPIIIHTTNSPAAIGMETVLQEAGWKTLRVVPHDDLAWVAEDWYPVLRQAIVGSIPGTRPSQAE